MNTSRRSKTRRGILVAIVLVALIAVIGGTYAIYSSNFNATAKIDAAKWNVSLKGSNNGTDVVLEETTKEITFVVNESDYVVSNKIAPSVTATATLELDLTGTEVGVDFLAEIDKANIQGIDADKLTLSIEDENGSAENTIVYSLPEKKAFTSTNGKHTITLTLTWKNEGTTSFTDTDAGKIAKDAEDTAIGTKADSERTITIPVKLMVAQHIG